MNNFVILNQRKLMKYQNKILWKYAINCLALHFFFFVFHSLSSLQMFEWVIGGLDLFWHFQITQWAKAPCANTPVKFPDSAQRDCDNYNTSACLLLLLLLRLLLVGGISGTLSKKILVCSSILNSSHTRYITKSPRFLIQGENVVPSLAKTNLCCDFTNCFDL